MDNADLLTVLQIEHCSLKIFVKEFYKLTEEPPLSSNYCKYRFHLGNQKHVVAWVYECMNRQFQKHSHHIRVAYKYVYNYIFN